MGLFDAFKKKKDSGPSAEVEKIFEKIYNNLFPNSKSDINAGAVMIKKLSNNKLTEDEARSHFLQTSYLIVTSKDALDNSIKEYIKKITGGSLSETEIDAIYHFIVKYVVETLQKKNT